MENIQKLIVELKMAKLRAARYSYKEEKRDKQMWAMYIGQVMAFNFTIKKLKMLLEAKSNDSQNKQVEAVCSHPYEFIHISWDCQEVKCNCCGKNLD